MYDGATEATAANNMWYLNTQETSSCSGRLQAIEVQYYGFNEGGPHKVQVAVWKPIGDNTYTMVSYVGT